MRHVFKTLELLTDWMREGMFDFCVLPFSLKTDMRVEDRDTSLLIMALFFTCLALQGDQSVMVVQAVVSYLLANLRLLSDSI